MSEVPEIMGEFCDAFLWASPCNAAEAEWGAAFQQLSWHSISNNFVHSAA